MVEWASTTRPESEPRSREADLHKPLDVIRIRFAGRHQAKAGVLQCVDHGKVGLAKICGCRHDGIEHGLQLARRLADNVEDRAGRALAPAPRQARACAHRASFPTRERAPQASFQLRCGVRGRGRHAFSPSFRSNEACDRAFGFRAFARQCHLGGTSIDLGPGQSLNAAFAAERTDVMAGFSRGLASIT